ncbi:MAG: hypothetical protein ACHP9Z_34835 [Streptosporangiales bacterium]
MADLGALSVLGDLQHHWGSAYIISTPGPDIWLAVRRDDHGTLRAGKPGELLELIRADYARRPVPRRWPRRSSV